VTVRDGKHRQASASIGKQFPVSPACWSCPMRQGLLSNSGGELPSPSYFGFKKAASLMPLVLVVFNLVFMFASSL
jgi:hypothetical protein